MSQDTQAIDLTISDDEDDSLPIYLKSSTSTLQRVGTPEPDEIQVIESPIHPLNKLAAGTERRRSSRPKPRPRNRRSEADVSAISSPDAAASITLSQGNDNAGPLASHSGKEAPDGEAQVTRSARLPFAPENGTSSTPNANPQTASGLRDSFPTSSASERWRLERDESSPIKSGWKQVTRSTADALVDNWTLKGPSRSLSTKEDAARWMGDGHDMEDFVEETLSAHHSPISGLSLASNPRDPQITILDTRQIRRPTPQPGPSRVSSRLRKKSQRAIESEETAQMFGISTCAGSALSSPKGMTVACASSSASTSSGISFLHKQSQLRVQALAEPRQTDANAERSVQDKPIDSNSFAAGIVEIPANICDIDIASATPSFSTIAEITKRDRKRSSPTRQNAETTVMSSHRNGERTNGDGTPTPRRSTRARKKTAAMKQYCEEIGQQSSKRTSRRARAGQPDQPLQRLSPPPPLPSGSVDDERVGLDKSSRPILHSEVSFLNDRSGFSLPSITPDGLATKTSGRPSIAMEAAAESASLKEKGAQRKVLPRKAKNRMVPELPTVTDKSFRPQPASVPIGAAHLSPALAAVRRLSQEAPVRGIPFPPCSPEDGENEYLKAVDFADARLMAACAALDTNGNKAMSAEQVATLCIKRGWLSKDLGASAQACISHAISSYTRRCQNAAKPRVPIISKRILNGGPLEASLYPGLDDDVLLKPKDRLSGTFYYLDGWVGSARWSSPFTGLDPDLSAAVNLKTQAHSNIACTSTNAPPAPQAEAGPRSAEPVSKIPTPAAPVASRRQPPRLKAMKAVTISRRTAAHTSRVTHSVSDHPCPSAGSLARSDCSPKLHSKITTQVQVSRTRSSARRPPSARITASHANVGGETSTEESDCNIPLNAVATGQASSVFRQTNRLLNLKTTVASDCDFGSGFLFNMDISGGSSGDESSTGMFVSEIASKVDRKVSDNATIYLSLSGDGKPAVFPDNPLGPVVWDSRPDAIPSKYVFEELALDDSISRGNEDDFDMRDLSEEALGVYQPTRASSTATSTTTRITWPEDRTAFREPPDLYHEDIDTPPTSPESFSDAASDDVSMVDANDVVQVGPVADGDELTDDSLVDAVQTLRGLLTTEPKLRTPSSADFTGTHLRELHKEPIRRLRPWSNESIKISLAPSPCIPSPSSSLQSACSSAISAYFDTGNPPSPTAAKEDSNDRFAYSWNLATGIQEQLSPAEVENSEICAFDPAAMEQGVLDEVKNVHRLLFDAANDLPEAAVLSGPESVHMEEFDKFWIVNEDGKSSSTPNRSVFFEENNFGVASQGFCSPSPLLRDPVNDTADSRVKRPAVQHIDSRATPIKADLANTMRVTIDENDQIGIKEVDDAMLCFWVEEEDACLEVSNANFSPTTEAGGKSGRKGYSNAQAPPSAVDPNLLGITKPVAVDVPRLLPTAPLLRSSRNDGSATWITASLLSQGSKAIPPLAVRPRAMVHCQTVSQSPSSGSATDPSVEFLAAQPITERSHVSQNPSKDSATDSSAESSTAKPNSGQLQVNRRSDRAPVSLEDKVRPIVVDDIIVYALPWAGIFLLRRIDSDFINVSTLCRSLRKPELEPELRTLAGAVEVRGNTRSMVNGFWVHLSLVTANAGRLEMPEELRQVLLDPNLVRRYPTLLASLENLRTAPQGLPKFGPPFGYIGNKVSAMAQRAGQTTMTCASQSVPPFSPSSSRLVSNLARTSSASPAMNTVTSEAGVITMTKIANRRNTTAVKRANPLAPPDPPHSSEPPSKRQRPTESPDPTSTPSVSRNIRPIIPVGVATTLTPSVVESSSMLATYVSSC